MKHGFAIAAVVCAGLFSITAASAEGMSGNTQFIIGERDVDEFWKPLDRPMVFGFEVDFAPETSPIHVAFGFNFAGDSKHVSTPFYGHSGHVDAFFFDMSTGFVWQPVKKGIVRPYLGAGAALVFAGIGTGYNSFHDADTDQSFGFYANGGIFFKVGDVMNVGFDGRIVRGTKVNIAGVDGNADYSQLAVLIGFSWGSGHPAPPPPSHPDEAAN